MNSRDVFGLIVRVAGLAIFLFGLSYLGANFWGMIDPQYYKKNDVGPIYVYSLYGLIFSLAGLGLMRWAKYFVWWAYPEEKKREPLEGTDKSGSF